MDEEEDEDVTVDEKRRRLLPDIDRVGEGKSKKRLNNPFFEKGRKTWRTSRTSWFVRRGVSF